jgi:hypothetical protein
MTEQLEIAHLKIAHQVSRIIHKDQILRIFREHAKQFCADSQKNLDEKTKNGRGITSDEESDDDLNGKDLPEEESVSRAMPRDPIRGGEDFKPATTIRESLSEQYTALAALHDEKLEDDIQILADIPGSHYVKARFKHCKYRYNTDFYETALECVKADLDRITGGMENGQIQGGGKMPENVKSLQDIALDVAKMVIVPANMERFREQYREFCEVKKENRDILELLILPDNDSSITKSLFPETKTLNYTDAQKLMGDYVLLTIVHDKALKSRTTIKISEGICPASKDESWCDEIWQEIKDNFVNPAREDQITPAFNRVEKDLEKKNPKRNHSEDFTSVVWDGIPFVFTKSQAAVVKLLWCEYEKGTWTLSEKTIGEGIGSSANNYRIIHTFDKGKHPAWGTLIISGPKKGTFRIANTIQQKPIGVKKAVKKSRKK